MARVQSHRPPQAAWLTVLAGLGCIGMLALFVSLPGAPEQQSMLETKKSAVEAVLKAQLQQQENEAEGKLYAAALKNGGIALDQTREKAVAAEVGSAKRTPASLAVDERLQKNVQLASEIVGQHPHTSKLAHASHVMHHSIMKNMEDVEVTKKLELARMILAHAETADAQTANAEHMKSAAPVHKTVEVAHKAPRLSAAGRMERSMTSRLKEKLSAREQEMFKEDVQKRIQRHPDLAVLRPKTQGHNAAIETLTQSHERALRNEGELGKARPAHSAKTAGHASRERLEPSNYELEKELRDQLNSKEHDMEKTRYHQQMKHMRGNNVEVETPLGGPFKAHKGEREPSNYELEEQMRRRLDAKVHSMEEKQLQKQIVQLAGQGQVEGHGGKKTVSHKVESGEMKLEAALKRQLDSKVHAMQQQQLGQLLGGGRHVEAQGSANQHHAKGGREVSSDMRLEAALRQQLNSKADAMEKQQLGQLLGDGHVKAYGSAQQHVKKGTDGAIPDERTLELALRNQLKHQTDVMVQGGKTGEEKKHSDVFSMEGVLKSELDDSVNHMERSDFVQSRILALKHPRQANKDFLADLNSARHTQGIVGGGHGKQAHHMSEMGMEKLLRSQLNARVQAKEKENFVHSAKVTV